MNRSTRSLLKRFDLTFAMLLAAALVWGSLSLAQTTTPSATTQPGVIRIKAGADAAMKDSKGNLWAADTGFDGGDTTDRPDLQITGTDRPELYRSEHFSMNSFTVKVPDGDYMVKLHFSEDYDGITDPSERVFTYAVIDGDPAKGKMIKEVKDFSPWKAAGAQFKAYVDTVPLTVASGQISIKFTPQTENPQINAIEIAPK